MAKEPAVRPVFLVLLAGVLGLAFWRRKDVKETLTMLKIIKNKPPFPKNVGGKRTKPIDMIIIHVIQGSAKSAASWFSMDHAPSNLGPSSAHYIIDKGGVISQSVPDDVVAYHAGNSSVNGRSIGIELEGFVDKPDNFTAPMMASLASLVKELSAKYKIPLDRTHIIGHDEVPDPKDPTKKGGATKHTDPGKYFPWTAFMQSIGSDIARV